MSNQFRKLKKHLEVLKSENTSKQTTDEVERQLFNIQKRKYDEWISKRKFDGTTQISSVDYEDFDKILEINRSSSVFRYSSNDMFLFMDHHHKQISKVAKIDNKVVGYAIMKQNDRYTHHLLQIVVSNEHRRKGIAKQLMSSVIDNAIKTGMKTIKLEVRETNVSAINLYKVLGFSKNRVMPNFYKNENAIEFVLDLTKRTFDEGKHKRDSGGQFSTQEGEKAPKEKKPKKAPKQRKERKPGNISQEEAKYTDSSKVSGQRCSNCINILRIKNSPVRRCTKVKGVILDSGWSQFWQASKKEEDPTRV